MSALRTVKIISATLLLSVALFGCQKKESRWDAAQRESSQPKTETPAPAAPPATAGGSLNKFFPKAADGFEVTPSQEKKGFAEYKLKKDGKEMAMLSISDTSANSDPNAVGKYKQSSLKVGGYPAVALGNTMLSVLVADRYQVKVQSKDPAFTKTQSEAWIQKFDLAGIAQLK
jgi:hypothetical protein